MRQKIVLAILATFFAVSAFAQVTVKGKVINKVTGEGIEGAVIRIDGELGGCSTNTEGAFEINAIEEGEHTIRITHVSYLPLKAGFTAGKETDTLIFELEENYMNLGQVVVTGTGTHHRMSRSPIPVNVITAKDIRNSSATSLEEVLTKLNPSFSFSTNGMGTTMTLNGVNQDYVLILINGKKMAGDDTYSRINIDNIKRIEVLNGAASALYGSDAIGGVINVITDDPKNTVDISSNTRVSSYERISESASATISNGKFSSYTNYRYAQSGNWQLNRYDQDSLLTGKMNSTGYRSHNADQRFVYDINRSISVYVRGSYYNHSTKRPGDTMSQDKKDPEKFKPAYTYDLKHENYLYGAGMKYIINPKAYLEADFYSDNSKAEKEYFGNDRHEAGERTLDKMKHFYDGTVRGIFKLGGRNKLSAGAEYIYESLDSEKTSSANPIHENMYTVSLFAQDEWNIGKGFSAVGGVRYIYHRNFRSYATPNISVMYNYKGFNVRLAYAGGFRTPDLSQIYTTSESKGGSKLTLPNLELKPEKSNYYTLNLEYNHPRFSIRASGYYNDMHDMINYQILTPDEIAAIGGLEGYDEVQQRRNIDRARIAGVNVFASAYLGAGFNLSAAYAFNDAYNISEDKPIDKSLKHAGTFNLEWKHTWDFYQLNINVNGRVQGERYSDRYDPAPAYTMWDINTRHRFTLKKVILEPGVGIENLFNYKDDRLWNNNFATLSPGRSVYVSLIVRFLN